MWCYLKTVANYYVKSLYNNMNIVTRESYTVSTQTCGMEWIIHIIIIIIYSFLISVGFALQYWLIRNPQTLWQTSQLVMTLCLPHRMYRNCLHLQLPYTWEWMEHQPMRGTYLTTLITFWSRDWFNIQGHNMPLVNTNKVLTNRTY